MSTVSTIAETVKSAALRLSAHSESPRLDAELLLGKVLGVSRASLIARDNQSVAPGDELQLKQLLLKRERGVAGASCDPTP